MKHIKKVIEKFNWLTLYIYVWWIIKSTDLNEKLEDTFKIFKPKKTNK